MTRARPHSQRGFTLIEVLIVSSLFLVVLTATLTAMTSFERVNRDNQRVNDQTERARRAVDRGMRQLRNLASRPVTGVPTISRATATDFIFQTSDPTRTWVRYCSQTVTGGKAKLWALTSAASTAPTTTTCPGATTAWPKRDVVATNVTNKAVTGRDFPLFTFARTCPPGSPTTCPTDLGTITSVSMDLLLDDNLARKPDEVRVSSAVFLRNQNELPVAAFTARGLGSRQVLLNGSSSTDPEGRTLRYMWFRAPAPTFTCTQAAPAASLLGLGVSLNYTFIAGDGNAGQTRDFTLVVCDPGDLQARSTASVTIP